MLNKQTYQATLRTRTLVKRSPRGWVPNGCLLLQQNTHPSILSYSHCFPGTEILSNRILWNTLQYVCRDPSLVARPTRLCHNNKMCQMPNVCACRLKRILSHSFDTNSLTTHNLLFEASTLRRRPRRFRHATEDN